MKPILVTGAHRTGTTWVGKVIATTPSLTYISEPLNVNHSLGVLGVPIQHWYTYICEANEAAFLNAYRDTLNFRYRTLLAGKSLQSWDDLLKMVRDQLIFLRANLLNHRPLLKDPFAVFSVPWFSRKLNCRIIVVVRHPLGFVSSLKRLDWSFDFHNLLAQPQLIQDHLEEYREEMADIVEHPGDIIGQGILLWKVVYSVVAKFGRQLEDVLVVRHEDLSLQPLKEFSKIFNHLDLGFNEDISRKIVDTSQGDNPQELPLGREHAVQLDSRANLGNWRRRLTTSEVDRIVASTKDHLDNFYDQDEWRVW